MEKEFINGETAGYSKENIKLMSKKGKVSISGLTVELIQASGTKESSMVLDIILCLQRMKSTK